MPSVTLADAASRVKPMAKRLKQKKKWMADAVKPSHEGKFTAKAHAAGKSVREYAEEKHDAGGTLGKEATLAQTFEKTAHKKSRAPIYKR